MLMSDLCDYSYAYNVVKERITIRGSNMNNKTNKNLTFKNNAPFKSCTSNVNNTFIDNAEDLVILCQFKTCEGIGTIILWHQ